MRKTVKQLGIGLLELMLVLAIVAIILVIATRYFEVANRSRLVNAGFKDLQTATTAAHSWWEDNNRTFKGLNMDGLINNGYLSKEYEHNPWGGDTTIEGESDRAIINMKNIGDKACYALVLRLDLKDDMDKICKKGREDSDFRICTTGSKKYAACS